MRTVTAILFLLLIVAADSDAGSNAGSNASRRSATAAEVIDRVQKAVELLRDQGDAAIAAISDPEGSFVWKDSYVFVVNCEADRVIANPAFPERVGGDIKQHTDYAGYRYGKELCKSAQADGGGWLEYSWLKPGHGTPQRKLSFVMSVPGRPYQVGAGLYPTTAESHDEETGQ